MFPRKAVLLALLPLGLSACDYNARPRGPDRASAPRVPAARVVGAPQSCIPLTQIRESRIRDDATIDFIGNGKQVWRVSLSPACPGLKSENRFTYATSLSQLCSTDIIYVLQDYGGTLRRGAGCGLNQFVPVELGGRR